MHTSMNCILEVEVVEAKIDSILLGEEDRTHPDEEGGLLVVDRPDRSG